MFPAMKIHISDATYKALNEIGNFKTSPRGEIPIKGKGTMETYWLDGRDDETHLDKPENQMTSNGMTSSCDSRTLDKLDQDVNMLLET